MKSRILLGIALVVLSCPILALDVSELHQLLGYTLIDIANVPGEFEGADFDKVVKLSNGMIFEFQEYNYSYSYMPDVAVFARRLELKSPNRSITVYKLIIEDEVYDVRRIR